MAASRTPVWPSVKARLAAKGLLGTEPVSRQDIVAVIDTNVMIDIYSCHDLSRAEPEKVSYRVSRARDSLLLGIYFDHVQARTWGIAEILEVMALRVPPEATPTVERQFTNAVLYFLKDHVLGAWRPLVWNHDQQPRGTPADRFLIDVAANLGKPLITNESELRDRSRERGIDAYTPGEYWAAKQDPETAARRFLARYRAAAPQYARSQLNPVEWQCYLDELYPFYRKILLGRG